MAKRMTDANKYQEKMLREEKERVDTKAAILPKADFRSITRRSDICLTQVIVRLDFETKVEWLTLGESRVRSRRDTKDGNWRLDAYLPIGVTDFEHDSAYALQLPLIGLQFDHVYYHRTYLTGWVDPDCNDGREFRVPGPGYDPMSHPEAVECRAATCKSNKPFPHMIVPQNFYVPPFNLDLYKIVKGKQVEIRIGPIFEKEDET